VKLNNFISGYIIRKCPGSGELSIPYTKYFKLNKPKAILLMCDTQEKMNPKFISHLVCTYCLKPEKALIIRQWPKSVMQGGTIYKRF
jgi:hypothetical protein